MTISKRVWGLFFILIFTVSAEASARRDSLPRTRLRFSQECILRLVADRMNIRLDERTAPPRIHLESKIPLKKFQDAIEPQWGFRPSAVLNSYVIATNEIYLNDREALYAPRGRSLDESLAHELVHFLQMRYLGADPAEDLTNETTAADVQTWFRESFRGRSSKTCPRG